jgi:putative pyruvate formate lyase activating enzyme
LHDCDLCPHRCGANRAKGEQGRCGIGATAVVSAAMKHFGEEPPLVKNGGSGTVFFSGCIATCCFCQNFQISILKQGYAISVSHLRDVFLELQRAGCSNINWVTPTPQLPFLLKAFASAMDKGLNLPLVYNCNGYMNSKTLEKLDGIVDIYLPDVKYGQDVWAVEYSGLPDYTEINRKTVQEMYRQVGLLKTDEKGAAESGLIVRHLVLPENRAGTADVFKTIVEIDENISVSVMAQYRPCYKAVKHSVLGRPLFYEEFEYVKDLIDFYGLPNVFTQSMDSLRSKDGYFPDFNRKPDRVFDQDSSEQL